MAAHLIKSIEGMKERKGNFRTAIEKKLSTHIVHAYTISQSLKDMRK